MAVVRTSAWTGFLAPAVPVPVRSECPARTGHEQGRARGGGVSGRVGDAPSLTAAGPPPRHDERRAFADMYDAHARHVFDYCAGLLGDRQRAAAAAQATLIAAHLLAGRLQDRSRMRAWLLALARLECQDSRSQRAARRPGSGSRQGHELARALAFVDSASDDGAEEATSQFSQRAADEAAAMRAMLAGLPATEREVLDLIYRHRVRADDLAAILGIAPDSSADLLARAEASLASADDHGEGDPADAVDHTGDIAPWAVLSALPLTSLPPSFGRRVARAVLDPRFEPYRDAVRAHAEHLGPDGFPVMTDDRAAPPARRLLAASALLAALLLVPAGLGAAGYAAFSGLSAGKAPHQHSAVLKGTTGAPAPSSPAQPSPGTSAPRSGRSARTGHSAGTSPAAPTAPPAGSSSAKVPQPTRTASASPSRHASSPPAGTLSPPPRKSASPSPSQSATGTTSPTQTPSPPASSHASGGPGAAGSPASSPG